MKTNNKYLRCTADSGHLQKRASEPPGFTTYSLFGVFVASGCNTYESVQQPVTALCERRQPRRVYYASSILYLSC